MTKFLSILCLLFTCNSLFSQTVCNRHVAAFDYSTTTGYSIQGTADLKDSLGVLYLTFSTDFSTSSGPDLYVYLTETGAAPTAVGNDDIEIAVLTSATGSQTYILPSSVSIDDYDYVTIHCKQFDHLWNSGLLGVETCFTYPTYSEVEVNECFSYTSPSGNNIWETTGEYSDTLFGMNVDGGDSVITIDLTIQTVDASVTASGTSLELTANASNATFQWINCSDNSALIGETNSIFNPTVSGNYAVLVTSADNCEMKSSCFSVLKLDECISYLSPSGSNEWLNSGFYTDTLVGMSSNGNDSIILIDLSINTVNLIVSQSISSNELTAEATNSTFQWINCADNSVVTGETNSSFTPTMVGDYAVVVTSMENCTDTSECMTIQSVGIDENTLIDYNVYPNPTEGIVNINIEDLEIETIQVFNILNQAVGYNVIFSQSDILTFEVSGSIGVYHMQFINKQGKREVVKIVKH